MSVVSSLLLQVGQVLACDDHPAIPTDVLLEWTDTGLAITNSIGDVDVMLKLRMVHGADDIRWYEPSLRILSGETVVVDSLTFTWPDLSHKGTQLATAADLVGVAVLVSPDGVELGVRPLRRRRVMLEGASPELWAVEPLEAVSPATTVSTDKMVLVQNNPTAGVTP